VSQAAYGTVLCEELSIEDLPQTLPDLEPRPDGDPHRNFTALEMQAFQGDDAMAVGMICTILCLAFVALVGLVTAVNVWTFSVAGH